MNDEHDEAAPAPRSRRASRVWLFAPFVLVGLVVVGWSVAWFLIRDRVADELDRVLGVQATLGRTWTCADREIAGFPFRIEISCATLALRAPAQGLTLDLGPSRAVAQVYQPRHVIVNVGGPLRLETPEARVAANWALMEASIRNLGRGTEQLALVIDRPDGTVETAALPQPVTVTSDRVQVYARPAPDAAAGALDVVVRADAVSAPALDEALAVTGPAEVELQMRARGVREAVARRDDPVAAARAWRDAGGRIDIEVVSVRTPAAAFSLTGALELDGQNRPQGAIEASGWGLGPIARRALGDGGGFMADAIVAALGGPDRPEPGSTPNLTPLPTLRVDQGRVFVGPVPVPIEVPPLF